MCEKESCALRTYAKLETGNHFKNIRSYKICEQLIWNLTEKFSTEFHYAYIYDRSIIRNSPWHWQQRLELEANFSIPLSCKSFIKTRNRLEIRKLEREPKIHYRLRQRTMLVFPLENKGALKSFSMYNELFYDLSTQRFSQDRICPFQFTYLVSKKIDLDLFFLIHFFHTNTSWKKSGVIGTQLSF
jgi:hypothetical protein